MPLTGLPHSQVEHSCAPLPEQWFERSPVLAIFFQLDPLNPTIGGIQTCIRYVIKYAPRAFHIRLIGITQDRALVGKWQALSLDGREFEFLPLLDIADDNIRQPIPTTIRYALALRRYLRRHRLSADFYQFHRIEPTLFTASLSGTKLLYIHNDIAQEIAGNAKGGILWRRFPWAYFALERRLVGQFDRILSCNSRSAALYRQRYPEIAARVSYLPNTFDGELFYPLDESGEGSVRSQTKAQWTKAQSLDPEAALILFAGRLHPQKRPDLLIAAMAHLVQLAPDLKVHLLIVGKGELEGPLRAEIQRLNVRSRVTMLGPLAQTELADLYRLCDLFVLTSAYEGLARGSLEALACGTPVVTTRAGELPSFLEHDSGIVCEESSPKAIAQAWLKVIQNPQAFPRSAPVRVAQPYQAQSVVSQLYSALLHDWQVGQAKGMPLDSAAPAAAPLTSQFPSQG